MSTRLIPLSQAVSFGRHQQVRRRLDAYRFRCIQGKRTHFASAARTEMGTHQRNLGQRDKPYVNGRFTSDSGSMIHDYKRHGTTTLFAALDGRVIGQCMQKHRHQEFIRFLNRINREVAPDLDVHLIADNYATHKHPKVKAWLARHPRFHMHFTPTSASWLNQVERFFAEIRPA
jgi:hypothetical protein